MDLSKVDFIYKVNESFNIPIYSQNSFDDCDFDNFYEMDSISANKGDIIFMSNSPEDKDLLVIKRHDTKNGEKELNFRTSLSVEFLRINKILFTEIPKKIYNRDLKIDEIIA